MEEEELKRILKLVEGVKRIEAALDTEGVSSKGRAPYEEAEDRIEAIEEKMNDITFRLKRLEDRND